MGDRQLVSPMATTVTRRPEYRTMPRACWKDRSNAPYERVMMTFVNTEAKD